MSQEIDDEYKDVTLTKKLSKKAEESPFVVAGIVGVVGSCIYATYRYRSRGPAISTSIFLMQLRVLAQGMFAGLAALGVASQAYKDHQRKKKERELEQNLKS